MSKTIVMLKTTELLEAFGLVVSEDTYDVMLEFKDGFCSIKTYTNIGLPIDESNKIKLLGCSKDVRGLFRCNLFIFEKILKVVNYDLEECDNDLTVIVFDEKSKRVEFYTTNGIFRIEYNGDYMGV